jgi:hypothetical protein
MGNFMGKDGFVWFVGVVEDRLDPNHLGRLKVRALGYHTEDMIKLPTADLPWSHVLNPITSATVSGVGQSPLGAVEGSWVMGYFRDGGAAQEAVIMGTLPGVPGNLPTKVAKNEDDNKYPGKGFQDYKNANYPKYKETDVNRLSVGDADNPHSTLTLRKADVDVKVSQADIEPRSNIGSLAQIDDSERVHQDEPDTWSEPTTPYDAEYPYNHVYESEGGHIREMDDTPGKERIHERHASGSGYEIHPDGTKVTRVKKDNYTIITGDDYVHLQGESTKTIDGGLRVFINKDRKSSSQFNDDKDGNNYNIQVGAGANVTIQVDEGDINLIAPADTGNINMKAGGTIAIEAGEGLYIRTKLVDADVNETWTEIVGGVNKKTGSEIDMDADTINLN